jgi:indole-3-acetate monooxygenase
MAISDPGAVEVTHGEDVPLADIARRLEPLIREHADALEQGRIPAQLADALHDAGVFKAMLPREVGGLEAEPVEWLRMIEEFARINASVGWTAFIQSGVGLGFLDPERFERFRVRGGGRLILAMNLGRMAGQAVKVEGGYRISGRWPFASGSPFATWLGGMSVVCAADGSPVLDASGQPQRLLAIWPADQARLIDTWDGLGLRGTGSGDFEIADLFVPQEQVNPGFYGKPAYDRALFRIKEMPEVGHGAHALGVASAALESFVAAVNSKPLPGSTRHMAMGHMQAHQIAFARADVLVRAARTLLHATVREAYEDAQTHQELALELRVRLREANIFAVRSAKEAVERRVPRAPNRAGVPRCQYRGQPHQLRGDRVHRDRLLLPDQGPRQRPGDRRAPVLLGCA